MRRAKTGQTSHRDLLVGTRASRWVVVVHASRERKRGGDGVWPTEVGAHLPTHLRLIQPA